MSPFEISILLHYHTRPGDFRDGDFSAPIIPDTLESFVDAGILRRVYCGEQQYEATDALKVYVGAICAVPLPVQRWVMPSPGDPAQ